MFALYSSYPYYPAPLPNEFQPPPLSAPQSGN
jgi:hypothetical protein